MLRIERSDLLEELWQLSLNGSLVITGSPGVGKTWMIAQFIRKCQRENRPCLPLAAEDFDVRSIQDITR
jgi:KaiC/GvpD/RAD55 family RecA-like ATPase